MNIDVNHAVQYICNQLYNSWGN